VKAERKKWRGIERTKKEEKRKKKEKRIKMKEKSHQTASTTALPSQKTRSPSYSKKFRDFETS
jgi:hypothetical protein